MANEVPRNRRIEKVGKFMTFDMENSSIKAVSPHLARVQ
jgi:hypothetical protein